MYNSRLVFFAILVFCAGYLHAAPLAGDLASFSPSEARLRVIAAAEKYENTPYRYGGLDRRGLDCSGLVYVSFYDALGVSVPRNAWELHSWSEKIATDDLRPGDLVFFKTTRSGNVSHVGIFVGNRRFIHSASEGPATGVIYSSLDEQYYSRTYAGAGRALPEADISGGVNSKPTARNVPSPRRNNLLMGFALAPTWNTFIPNVGVIRGAAGHFRLGVALEPLGQPMIFGAELRPEWDRALGIFRVPLTLSWGIDDKFRIFAGPVLSFGNAELSVSGENRQYTGGTSWICAAGMTIAPFAIKIAGSDLAPYGELAWQSYFSNSDNKNIGADIAAGLRVSTGLRYTWRK
ncbi:MAG: C40 family peptidase [Treponema sp.]|jgi:probable lipoprotein NlpC|nr:C40 family peptidase [Treponema sp.]